MQCLSFSLITAKNVLFTPLSERHRHHRGIHLFHIDFNRIYLQEHCHIDRDIIYTIFPFVIFCINHIFVYYTVRELDAEFVQ